MPKPNCVEELVEEIRKAVDNELYVIAVMSALTLPDMCAALEKENFWARNVDYAAWCRQNLPPEFFSLAPPELMKDMRNSMLHTGRLDDPKGKGGRLVLTLPPKGISITNCRVNDDFLTDLTAFCEGLCVAATRWLHENESNPIVQNNLTLMVQRRENGMSPYVRGIDVIA